MSHREPSLSLVFGMESGHNFAEQDSGWRSFGLLVLGALPFLLTMNAGLLSEDSTILRYVHEHAVGSDFWSPQYGMRAIRFWRPLVTLSWKVQETLGGAHVAWLRLANIVGILAAGGFAWRVARALGLSVRAAGLALLFVVWFPFAGGTVVWISGRTDVFVTALLLAGLSLSLERRHLAAAVVMLAAAATKETGFVLPAWVALFWWARGVPLKTWLGAVVPVALAAGLGLVLRRAALGVWVGGYPHVAGVGELGGGLSTAIFAWLEVSWPTLVLVGGLAVLGAVQKSLAPRVFLAALIAAIVAVMPLFPMLRVGGLGLSNARLLEPSCAALALAAAACVARRPEFGVRARLQLAGIIGLLLVQGLRTGRDAQRWAANANRSAARFAELHSSLGQQGAASQPMLVGGLPVDANGLYLFQFGVADQFLPPVAEHAREVWPDRPLFGWADSQRACNRPHLDESVAAASPTRWPGLELQFDQALPLVLDERVLDSESSTAWIELAQAMPQPGRLEVLLYTSSGYEVATDLSLTEPRVNLRMLLQASGERFSLGEAWMQAVDLGAKHAYLELRWVGSDGPTHVSDWVELFWADELGEAVARALGYE